MNVVNLDKLSDEVKDNPRNYICMGQPKIFDCCYGFDLHYQFYICPDKLKLGNAVINVYRADKIILWDKFYPATTKNPWAGQKTGLGIKTHNLILKSLCDHVKFFEKYDIMHLANVMPPNKESTISKSRLNQIVKLGINTNIDIRTLDRRDNLVFGECFDDYFDKSINYMTSVHK